MGIDRRSFISFLAGGAVGTLVTPIPWKLTDDISIWTQNWSWIPKNPEGASEYVPTVSKLCPSGCPVRVRTVGGKPVGVRGNAEHPYSRGGVTPLAAAEAELLYSPARVRRPLRRTPDQAYVAISWDEALAILEEKLGAIKGYRGKLAMVSGDPDGTINEVFSAFLAKAGSADFYLMPGEAQVAAKAWNDVMGGQGAVGYDIGNSDMVLAVGADVLESWGQVVRNRKAFADKRPHGEKPKAKYVYAGPVQNNTAAGADAWVPINPGTEAAFLLGLTYQVLKEGFRVDAAPDFDEFKTFVMSNFAPQNVQRVTGVAATTLVAVAKDLLRASAPLIVTGSEFGQGGGGAAMVAGLALNLMLGGLNRKGGLQALPDMPQVVSGAKDAKGLRSADLVAYLADVDKGRTPLPEAMLFYEANAAYGLPEASKAAATLAKVPFKASFSVFFDETAAMSDLVLPVPLGMERWDDICTPYGSGEVNYQLARQVIEPVFEAVNAGDVFLALAAKLGMSLGYSSFRQVLEAKASAIGADLDALQEGKPFTAPAKVTQYALRMNPGVLAKAIKDADKGGDIALAPVFYLRTGTGSTAVPPFNLKTIRDTELLGKESFVQLNAATAGKLGLREGDRVSLSNEAGTCAARVHINEGVMTDAVAALLGFGHTAFDAYSQGKGDNVAKVMKTRFEPGTGIPVWAGAKVKIAKI
ncbi:MAG: molybdopterin-dependent oxidoreductase [Desulfovibrionaceae bacterium]|jgi:anaerobic selenocysteine-containing dehydrogenase|nr:molybdopterin-dependent oxidoreductase [Desulfovibrionaceae bacterium]